MASFSGSSGVRPSAVGGAVGRRPGGPGRWAVRLSGAGAAYLFAKVAGTWGTTPVAIFEGSSDENLGFSVALSGDGRVALVGAPFAGSRDSAAYLYTESAGSWPPSLRRASWVLRATGSARRWRCRPTAGWRWSAPRSPAG